MAEESSAIHLINRKNVIINFSFGTFIYIYQS